ncbi:MAG TPA: methyltransferase domain-containing protein [Trebonia sp.]|jgi:SAM-dependent methyltransferase|nr:methyltransferase domain-containing protein [Trebonia sp.]
MTTVGGDAPAARASTGRFFAEPLREYVQAGPGRQVCVLQAGCLAPLRELGLGELAEAGYEVSVSVADADEPLPRAVLDQVRDAYDDVITGDLRTVPLPPRGFDVVYCGRLIERVPNVELVLDRLVSALRPGGLLFIRTADRDSARARLDRLLPGEARAAIWRRFHPGVPGPFPAVYEEAASERGIASYALLRGLVIAQRSAELTAPGGPGRLASAVRLACAAISRLSRGRYDDGHDELLYVIRKPEDRSARVV